MKKLLTLIALILALALTLASCGLFDQESNNNPGGEDSENGGNTDEGNTDEGNTDEGNTDEGNTDEGNTDEGNTDEGNTDEGNTDEGNNGNDNVEAPCNHEWGEESLVEVEGETICVDGGTYTKTCTKCGDVESRTVEPTGHDYTDFKPVFDPDNNKYICEDGGMLVKHCVVCGDIQHVTVGPGEYPHTVYNWSLISLPTVEDYGIAFGTCQICAADVTYELPNLASEAYTVETIQEATCGQNGEYKYTYIDADRNIDFSFERVVAATGHKLNGANYEIYNINNGSFGVDADDIVVPYWFGEPDADGRLTALNIKQFNGHGFWCETTGSAYFVCEECNEVINIYVYYDHNGVSEIEITPTCQSTGTKRMNCDNCTYSDIVEIPLLPHVYTGQLVYEDAKFTDSKGYEWDLYNLVGVCIGNGCDSCGAENVLAENIYDIVTEEIKAPTCLDFGVIKYTYKRIGYANVYSDIVSTFKSTHILNGMPIDYYVMTTVTPGIKEYINSAFKNVQCESMVDAYFICEYCDGIINVEVQKIHTESDVIVESRPSCEDSGEKSFICSNENCNYATGTRLYSPLPPLGHSYEYSIIDHCVGMTENQIENFVDIYGFRYEIFRVCTRESNGEVCGESSSFYAKKLEKTAECKPTCYSEGYILYNAKIDGEWVELKTTYAKTNHTLAGLIVGSEKFNALYVNPMNGAIYFTTPGIKIFANNELVCDTVVEGYYSCEVCMAAGVEASLIAVDVYKPHNFNEIVVSPTCTEPGTASCTDCDAVFEIPSLGHSHDLTYEVNVDTLVVNATGTCVREGCSTETEYTFYLPPLNQTEYYGTPTKVSEGVFLYTIILDGNGDPIAIDDNYTIAFITISFEMSASAE